MSYKDYDKPVYRGINMDQFKILDYEQDTIKQWCSFTSCSTSLKSAYGTSYKPYELVQVRDARIKEYLDKKGIKSDIAQHSIIEDKEKLPNPN